MPKVSKRADHVWKRLGSWYGARMAEQYGAAPPLDWRELIDRTDDERLNDALIDVRQQSPVHPPTLGQLEAAIPAKQPKVAGPSRAETLATHAVQKFALCIHQLARPWNYFGPIQEFQNRHRTPKLIEHPAIHGVQIPACTECDRPTHRLLLEDILT